MKRSIKELFILDNSLVSDPSAEGWWFESPVESSQRLNKLESVASLVIVQHSRPGTGLVDPVSS